MWSPFDQAHYEFLFSVTTPRTLWAETCEYGAEAGSGWIWIGVTWCIRLVENTTFELASWDQKGYYIGGFVGCLHLQLHEFKPQHPRKAML
jgi:hypothetical protein